jgi:putative transposase
LVREAPKGLDDYFRARALRKVDNDRTVSLSGRLYEAPVELIGKIATLLYHESDHARVEIFFGNASFGMLVPLDMNVNCRVRRDHARGLDIVSGETRYEGGKLFSGGRDE